MQTYPKTKIRSFISLLITVCILTSLFTVHSNAEYSKPITVYDKLYNSSQAVLTSDIDEDAMKEYLRNELIKCPQTLDISAFAFPQKDVEILANWIYQDIPELFHIENFSYYLNYKNQITKIIPHYLYTPSEYQSMYSECLEKTDRLVNDIKDNTNLTDVQKALLLHDRLAISCEYDSYNLLNGAVPEESYSMYGALAKGVAVCQGYSEAYLYLLDKVGIDSTICESDILNHAWNIVTIDGKKFHVDVTWDDPEYDVTGRVLHENFLLSSDGIYNSGHTATDYITTPNDTTYDNYFWQCSETAFQLLGNEIYYIDGNTSEIKKYTDKAVVCSVNDMWPAANGYYWVGNFSKLATDGKDLLFNKKDAVYKYDLTSKTTTKVWTPDFSENENFCIYGFTYYNRYLICDLYNSPSFTLSTKNTYQQKILYDINESEPVLSGISIFSLPEKTQYYIGDTFDPAGLQIQLNFSDMSTELITDGFELSGFSSASKGSKTVSVSYQNHVADFTISVIEPTLILSQSSLNLGMNEKFILSAETMPDDVTVVWLSSDKSIATVSQNGSVEGKSTGSAEITAKFIYNGKVYSEKCVVIVNCTHSSVTHHPATASTCKIQGWNAYTKCNDCKEIINGSDELLPLTDHKLINNASPEYIVTAATCTAAATYKKSCDFCKTASNKVFSYGLVDKNNHVKTKITGATEPDCITKGYTGDVICIDCNETITAGHAIDALGHTAVNITGYAASCIKPGLTDGKKCSVCGHIITAQTEILATGHTESDWQIIVPAQIDKEGLEQKTCTVCGDVTAERVITALDSSTEPPEETTQPDDLTTDTPPAEDSLGDINGDGKITAMDARLVLRIAAKLDIPTDKQAALSDFNGDGKLTAMDARLILRKSAKLD